MFRRFFATILILVFAFVSCLFFLVMALDLTVFKPSFYSERLAQPSYDFIVSTAVEEIKTKDATLNKHLNETDLRSEIMLVFTQDIYEGILEDFVSQLEKIKENVEAPIVISLKVFRDSLLTVDRNVAYKIFQSLPKCKEGEFPVMDSSDVPSCMPEGVDYNMVSDPVAKNLEKSLYAAIPDQIAYNFYDSNTKGDNFVKTFLEYENKVRFGLFGVMVLLLASVAILVWKPLHDLIKYEGIAFLVSGICGYVIGIFLISLPKVLVASNNQTTSAAFLNFIQTIFSQIVLEIDKIALIFGSFGLILILMSLALKRDSKTY